MTDSKFDFSEAKQLIQANQDVLRTLYTQRGLIKKERERIKIRSRRESRVTYDLPPVLRYQVRQLADQHRLPASQLVTLALLRFLNDYDQGLVNLSIYKQPSSSPRYDWNLAFPEKLLKILKKKLTDQT
ncbi:MAG: hypothetical protein WHV66_00460 [Anaerolineales bacterium]|jgi:hypothetical protein